MTTTMLPPVETYEEQVQTSDNPGDSAHIVMVPPGVEDQTPQAYVLRASIEGFPIEALCGYAWIPSKDPKRLPVCSACKDVYEQPGENREDRDRLPDA